MLKRYKVYFGIGRNSTMLTQEFIHNEKHDSDEDFEQDLHRFAEALKLNYLYKEPQ